MTIDNAYWYTEEGHRLLMQAGARVARKWGYPQVAKEIEKDAY